MQQQLWEQKHEPGAQLSTCHISLHIKTSALNPTQDSDIVL